MTKTNQEHRLYSRPGYHLRRASLVFSTQLNERLQQHELTSTEAVILISLLYEPNQTQSDLGRRLGIKRPNLVPVMARLVKRGLIHRVPLAGRAIGVSLTEAGTALAETADDITYQTDREFFMDDPDPEEIRRRLSALWLK